MSPLSGLRVLDFSHALAGPYCTMLLAQYGAEILKIEDPCTGDVGRSWGPPFTAGEASYFLGLNSGKRSLAIDLKKLTVSRSRRARRYSYRKHAPRHHDPPRPRI